MSATTRGVLLTAAREMLEAAADEAHAIHLAAREAGEALDGNEPLQAAGIVAGADLQIDALRTAMVAARAVLDSALGGA